ncbi:cytochrome P450 (plasmid) [Streptomyces sp. NBC_00190]|uniref:cytochrome P450 n=1 Tax=unclassified Streptomyces TaxID=2593676 RepID=UPI002E2955C8|nr:cytochrome P450 [Streptomyces sp. NBC_00190]WSZ45677.1 cytochrome P450 [Streptomyces sp. NBC_00868]
MTDTLDAPKTLADGAEDAPAYPIQRKCPYQMPPGYEGLREKGPISRVTLWNGRVAWLVTGNELGRKLFPDARLSSDVLDPNFPLLAPRIEAQRQQAAAPPLVGVDDPVHARQRRMVLPSFGVRQVNALRPVIQQYADDLLDKMLAGGPGRTVDLLTEYALPMPSAVICQLLGVPYEDHHYFDERSRHVLSSSGPEQAAQAQQAFTEILAYLDDLISRKQAEPGDTLLDELIARQLEDGKVDRNELAMIATVLLVSGHETTSNMIALSTMALLAHPEQMEALRADESLMPRAVDELMRYASIGDMLMRVAKEDIEVEGHVIKAGDGVILSTMLMNRDAQSFEKADDLDIFRPSGRHVAFGYGIHQCIGQNLARAEMEIALATLLRRVPSLRLAVPADQVPVNAPFVLQGVSELPVTW